MKAVYDPRQALHDPQFFLVKGKPRESTEQPQRAELLLAAVNRCQIPRCLPEVAPARYRETIHTPRYLQFLASAHEQWAALPDPSAEVVANVHPLPAHASYPQSIVGRAGWHMADTACPLGASTWQAACHSSDTAVTATKLVLNGETQAYALCRPPGHHAYADTAGGFCFLNNAAIAAQYALDTHQRVAIIDVDVHHGNGTQGIFYHRSDVLTVSIHADPANFYPFYWGYDHETGEGEGDGYNLNIPLAPLSGDDVFLQALDTAIDTVEKYQPGMLIVALGLDASEADPLRGLSVTTQGFERIGARLGAIGLPTVFVQEGGYLSPILADNLAAVLGAAANA